MTAVTAADLSSFERLAASSDVIVFGHTHRPYSKQVGDVLFVNAGSIGKPKDSDWRAGYILLTPGAPDPVQFIRVAYDVARAANAIRATDLPHEFADDIERGGAAARSPEGVTP
jgi:diadenosine tetraphosphatase ApaH/serine/threonine PP2A family protein phosphatase